MSGSRDAQRRWRAKDPEHAKALEKKWRDANPGSKHGLRGDDYQRKLDAQGGVCAICGASEPGMGRARFSVDHDHVYGGLRDLLCGRCNIVLGLVNENPRVLLALLEYLQRWRLWP